MGFRFRRSINLGGGFRINLSKSGVGYSWGTKGFRVTKTSRGTTRRTYSIPGTGISWVNESGGRKKKSGGNGSRTRTSNTRSNYNPTPMPRQQFQPAQPRQQFQPTYNGDPTRTIESADINQFKEAEEGTISDALERTIQLNWIGKLLLWGILLIGVHPIFVLVPIVGVALIIASHTAGRVNLEYTFDAVKQDEHDGRIAAWQLLAEGTKEWQVLTETFNSNRKVNAGAGRSIKRVPCVIKKGKPYYIDTNVDTIQINLANKETLIILPDKVFFVRKRKIGTIDYTDFRISVSEVRFIEEEAVPRDAQVVGQTWKYVNKNGTPDRRFSNNRQIPICLYGQVFLRSQSGLDVELQISNVQNARDFAELVL